MTKSYQELLSESQKFISFLQEQAISAELDENSFRDYNVKIKLLGTSIILYHKPSKKTFSIGCHHITNQTLSLKMQELWHQYLFPEELNIDGIAAYVDGSCINHKIGWGLVIVEKNEIIYESKGLVPLNEEDGSRQIAGEVYAVLAALEYVKQCGKKHVTIFYDYKGLEMWASNRWKASSSIAQFYVAKLMQYRISITWHKVSAHTGHIFNEYADRLAKSAVLNN